MGCADSAREEHDAFVTTWRSFVTNSRIDFHRADPHGAARVTCRAFLAIPFFLCACSKPDGGTDPASTPDVRVVRVDRADTPLAGISEPLLERFRAGDGLFEAMFREVDGLGPLYARASCSDCHAGDARGPGIVRRIGKLDPNLPDARLRELLPFGDMELPYATGSAKPLLFPETDELRKSSRLPPAVFGRGYIDAVDDEVIELGARQSRPGSAVSGRVARLQYGPSRTARIGRFGFKARTPDLISFVAEALHGDMGLTSSTYPDEPPNEGHVLDDAKPGLDVTDAQVEALTDYVRLLALPERTSQGEAEGESLFEAIGCSECHVQALRTRADYPITELAGIDAPLYTDLLLHDMGEELSDGVAEGAASAREWRTAPLIGLRFQSAFLHDGRAATVEKAIVSHGGDDSEAAQSKRAFTALSPAKRESLLRFVQGL